MSVLTLLSLSSDFDTIDHHNYSLPQTSISRWHFWNGSSVVWVLPHCWDSDCDCHWPELKTCGRLVSHWAQFLVLFSSFSILHLSALWLKLILSTNNLLQIHANVLTKQTCIFDVKTWMTQNKQNKLKLNYAKTEALLMKSNRTVFFDAQPTSQLFYIYFFRTISLASSLIRKENKIGLQLSPCLRPRLHINASVRSPPKLLN